MGTGPCGDMCTWGLCRAMSGDEGWPFAFEGVPPFGVGLVGVAGQVFAPDAPLLAVPVEEGDDGHVRAKALGDALEPLGVRAEVPLIVTADERPGGEDSEVLVDRGPGQAARGCGLGDGGCASLDGLEHRGGFDAEDAESRPEGVDLSWLEGECGGSIAVPGGDAQRVDVAACASAVALEGDPWVVCVSELDECSRDLRVVDGQGEGVGADSELRAAASRLVGGSGKGSEDQAKSPAVPA